MPDLSSIVRAAPIGLLMLIGSYVAARRRKGGARRAAAELPDVARELGLELRPPANPTGIGTVRGEHGGLDVFVDPEDRPRIVVYLRRAPAAYLRSYEHEKRPPPGSSSQRTKPRRR